tara:strand:+ start:388 stop:645 length:258 start_codon:yes stop_codon:yes gene_type:complete
MKEIKKFAAKVHDFIIDFCVEKGFLPGVYLGVGSLCNINMTNTAEFRIQDPRISDEDLLQLLKANFPEGEFWLQFKNNIFFKKGK